VNDKNGMMEQKILKELRFLKIYAIILTVLLIAVICFSFTSSDKGAVKTFKEITAQRINIVSPEGDLRMVLSNSDLQTPGRMNGVKLPDRMRQQGIVFFNKDGDEVGGLVFDNRGLVFSVDKYKNDQIMQLQYFSDEQGASKYGLQLWEIEGKLDLMDRLKARDSLSKLNYDHEKVNKILTEMNDRLLSPQRMFVGKLYNGDVGLFIKDNEGNIRIKTFAVVKWQDSPLRLSFLTIFCH